MLLKYLTVCCLLASAKLVQSLEDLGIGPVLIWPGISECETAANPTRLKKLFEERGSLVKMVKLGETCFDSVVASYWSIDDQVKAVCDQFSNDTDFENGFTVVGLSTGGLLARALVQKCSTVNVKSVVSLGGVHGGNFGILPCESITSELFEFLCVVAKRTEKAFGFGPTALTPFFSLVSDLSYPSLWSDPYRQTDGPAEIAINQLNNIVNPTKTYKTNLLTLEKFIAIYWTNDSSIFPPTSARFDEYKPGTLQVIPYNETEHYKKDLIGLRTLDETGRFIKIEHEGLHMEFEPEWFVENVMKKYLAGQVTK